MANFWRRIICLTINLKSFVLSLGCCKSLTWSKNSYFTKLPLRLSQDFLLSKQFQIQEDFDQNMKHILFFARRKEKKVMLKMITMCITKNLIDIFCLIAQYMVHLLVSSNLTKMN